MMKWLWLLLALLIAAAPAAAATRDEAPFRRGASVHNMLNWATVTADGVHYAWPPFQGAQRDVPDVLIDHLYEAGFDFIRLTVDPGPFLQFKGRQRDAARSDPRCGGATVPRAWSRGDCRLSRQ